jgi:hypothetical protein
MPRFSNRPFLATTLSFLSSRAQRADLRCAIRAPRSYRPTTATNRHRILMHTNLPFVLPGFQEWSAEPQIGFARDDKERTAVHKGRLLNQGIFKSNLDNSCWISPGPVE